MELNEALAVYLYLKDFPETAMNQKRRELRTRAWSVICRTAQFRINAEMAVANGDRTNAG
jgi:hypothetical protein